MDVLGREFEIIKKSWGKLPGTFCEQTDELGGLLMDSVGFALCFGISNFIDQHRRTLNRAVSKHR